MAKPSIAATNALGAELIQEKAPLHVPLFMVLSAEDTVTDANTARDWFCAQDVTPRHLVWYGRYPDAPFPSCRCKVAHRDPGVEDLRDCVTVRPSSCVLPPAGRDGVRPLPSPEICRSNPYASKKGDVGGAILDLAHIGLLAAPDNPRYGAEAQTNDCLHYSWQKETPEAQVCAGWANGDGRAYLRYGEISDGNLHNYILRRLTYNPDFDHMAGQMIDFLRRSN